MANMYRSVLSGGGATGDAVAADVLTGKTFSNAQASGINGTMPNNGAVSGTASVNQPYTIPAGYHNGNGIVRAEGYDFANANVLTIDGAASYTANCSVGDILLVWFRGNGGETLTVSGGSLLKSLNDSTLNDPLFFIEASATSVSITSSNANSHMHVAKLPKV